MPSRRLAACIFALTAAVSATAARAVVSISEPWVRAGVDGRTAELFMKLTSSDEAALVGVDTFAARIATLRAAGSPRQPLRSIALPAGTTIALAPGAARVSLTGLTRRLKFGEYVPVTLVLRGADGKEQKLYVNAEVRLHSPTEDEANPHGHDGHGHGK